MTLKVGKGTKIRFWKDTWCGDVELARRFPQLFNVAAQKSATVGELWDQNAGQGGWNLRFFRSFNDWELALVDELLQILRSQRITLEEDLALWKGGKNGKFDIKDAYGLLTSHNTSLFPKKGIWVENVPSKLAFFAWEATWGRVLTIDRLQKRVWQIPNRCYLCGSDEENVNHLLIHCTVASVLWGMVLSLVGAQWVFPETVKEVIISWKGMLQSVNTEIDAEKLSARLEVARGEAGIGQFLVLALTPLSCLTCSEAVMWEFHFQRHRACLSASLSSYSEKSTQYIGEMLQKVNQEERLRLAYGSPDHSSAYMNVDSQYSDEHDKLPAIDKKLQSKIPLQEIVPSSVLSSNDTHIDQSGSVGECSNPPGGPMDSGSSASAVCTSLKPDFTKLKGEICLDNLSIRELHETFKATFGRETSVKDKQWLKRRIAMGLTNSCDVSTTTFILKDNKSMKKVKEECCKSVDGTLIEDTVVGAKNDNCRDSPTSRNNRGEAHQILSGKRLRNSSVEYDCGSDDLHTEQIAGKRIRKPTKRYIEELSEADSREYGGRLTSSVKNSVHGQSSPKSQARPVRNVCSEGKTVVTRLDSLGGSGVQVPYVFRVRRSRPRKNFMALMKFNTNSMGMAAKLVKKALGVRSSRTDNVRSSRTDNEGGNKVLQSRPAPKRLQLPVRHHILEDDETELIGEPVKHEQCSVADTIELEQRVELKHVDSSGDTSDDNIATVPTAKGGMRRKHHRAWTLSEVMKLVDGVSRYGAGSGLRSSGLPLRPIHTEPQLTSRYDKWRNLLRASFALSPAEKGMSSRKHGSMPIPAAILLKVRELAEMHAQVAPNLGTSKPSGCGGRTVHETRAGFL
ncbi:hypothetical protein CK203_079593 [Vitis vinifera]|uniref:Reverse transcriptase zinc-binding domain-containing protein n=1 Tax=Vitis vinifera TaxID=29760 RepID=A0A438EWG3_VITVI|nr:hypothetical protein CK203_079593 [Vitis vinifera]